LDQWQAQFPKVARGKDHFNAKEFREALLDSLPANHPFRKNERLNAPKELMAGLLFDRIDGNRDGRVTREEWRAFFPRAAKGKDQLTAAAWAEALEASVAPPEEMVQSVERVKGPAYADKRSPGDGPGIEPLRVLSFLRGESGSFLEGPGLDDVAPDFTLKTIDGKESIHLSSYRGDKPLVLIFGNYT
jgi:hypothetical protein